MRAVFTGESVKLVPLETSHAEGLFEVGRDGAIWQWLPRESFQSLDDTKQWIDESLQQTDHEVFVIVDIASQSVIGSTRYLNIQPKHLRLEIGYTWLAKAYWGKPINLECKFLLLRHAFETLHYNRVQFKTDARNLRSQGAIAKLGASQEGILRCHMVVRNGFVRDSVLYSIIAREWPMVKQRLLQKIGRGGVS